MSNEQRFKRRLLFLGLCAMVFGLMLVPNIALAQSGGGLWTSAGQDVNNSRHQSTENKISSENVADLVVKWEFATGGDVSATPAVDGKAVYFPDYAGNLYALDRDTGALLWQRQISDYTGVEGDFARSTPAIHGNLLIFGDQGGRVGDRRQRTRYGCRQQDGRLGLGDAGRRTSGCNRYPVGYGAR